MTARMLWAASLATALLAAPSAAPADEPSPTAGALARPVRQADFFGRTARQAVAELMGELPGGNWSDAGDWRPFKRTVHWDRLAAAGVDPDVKLGLRAGKGTRAEVLTALLRAIGRDAREPLDYVVVGEDLHVTTRSHAASLLQVAPTQSAEPPFGWYGPGARESLWSGRRRRAARNFGEGTPAPQGPRRDSPEWLANDANFPADVPLAIYPIAPHLRILLRGWSADDLDLDALERIDDEFLNALRTNVAPDEWAPNGPSRIAISGTQLWVRARPAAHRAMARLLALLAEPLPPGGRSDLNPAEAELAKPAPPMRARPALLGEALDAFAARTGLRIVTDWKSLGELGIEPVTEVTFDLRGLDRAQGLERILFAAAGRDDALTWALAGDRVAVSTHERLAAPDFHRIVLYDLSDIMDRAVRDYGLDPHVWPWAFEWMFTLVRTYVYPDCWAPTGYSSILGWGDSGLLINTSPAGHRALRALLAMLKDPPAPGATSAEELAHLARRPSRPLAFRNARLDTALAEVADAFGLPLNVHWRAMEQLGIPRDTHITAAPGRAALAGAIEAVSTAAAGRADTLGFDLRDGQLNVSVRGYLPGSQPTRYYNVQDILAWTSGDAWMGAEEYGRAVDELMNIVRTSVLPDTWAPTGDASIMEFCGRLLIRQSPEGHRGVARLLARLRNPPRPGEQSVRHLRSPLGRRLSGPVHVTDAWLETYLKYLEAVTAVPIRPNWAALEHVGLRKESKVTVQLPAATLHEALAAALDPTAVEAFGRGGGIQITSAEDASTYKWLRFYNIRDLLDRSVAHSGEGVLTEELVDRWLQWVRWCVRPDSWAPTGDASILFLDGLLIVKQSGPGHRELAAFLTQLRQAAQSPPGAARPLTPAGAPRVRRAIPDFDGRGPWLVLEVYDLRHLMGRLAVGFTDGLYPPQPEPEPEDGGFFGDDSDAGPEDPEQVRCDQLLWLLREMVDPEFWAPLGEGFLLAGEDLLVVNQTPANQAEVARALSAIDRAARTGDWTPIAWQLARTRAARRPRGD